MNWQNKYHSAGYRQSYSEFDQQCILCRVRQSLDLGKTLPDKLARRTALRANSYRQHKKDRR